MGPTSPVMNSQKSALEIAMVTFTLTAENSVHRCLPKTCPCQLCPPPPHRGTANLHDRCQRIQGVDTADACGIFLQADIYDTRHVLIEWGS